MPMARARMAVWLFTEPRQLTMPSRALVSRLTVSLGEMSLTTRMPTGGCGAPVWPERMLEMRRAISRASAARALR